LLLRKRALNHEDLDNIRQGEQIGRVYACWVTFYSG
jgi:hypothetical protein